MGWCHINKDKVFNHKKLWVQVSCLVKNRNLPFEKKNLITIKYLIKANIYTNQDPIPNKYGAQHQTNYSLLLYNK